MSMDREWDTPSLTVVCQQDDSQRSSVITSAETNSVNTAEKRLRMRENKKWRKI